MSDDPITDAITAAVADADPTSEAAQARDAAADEPDGSTEETPDTEEEPAPDLDTVGKALDETKPEETPDPAESDEDEFASEHGIKSKEASGRENRIPYSRVKKITENAVKKATAGWETERSTLTQHNTIYTTRLQDIAKTEDIMLNDPDRFMEMLQSLPNVGERYAALVSKQAAAKLPTEADDPEPQPDGQLADGTPGYTPAQFKALRAWERRQAVREAEGRLSERFKPMETAFKTAQEQRKRQNESSQTINATIAEAATWRHFQTFAKEIYEAMEADSQQAAKSGKFKYHGPQAMRQAYEDVVFGRLHTDRQKQREEILKELEKTPARTSAGKAAAPPRETEETGVDPVEAAMRKKLRADGLIK